MKNHYIVIPAVCCLLFAPYSFAAKGSENGPADPAYEHASDNASFKRGEDDPDKHEKRESGAQKHKQDRRHERERTGRDESQDKAGGESEDQDKKQGDSNADREDRERQPRITQHEHVNRTGTKEDKPERVRNGDR